MEEEEVVGLAEEAAAGQSDEGRGYATKRVYVKGGKVAHSIPEGGEYSFCVVCRLEPKGDWLGTGNQEEYEKAESLPYCKERRKQ